QQGFQAKRPRCPMRPCYSSAGRRNSVMIGADAAQGKTSRTVSGLLTLASASAAFVADVKRDQRTEIPKVVRWQLMRKTGSRRRARWSDGAVMCEKLPVHSRA